MHCVLPAKSMVCPQSLRRHVQRERDVHGFGSAASRGCNAINVFARMPVRLTSIPIWTWAGGDPASISMPPTGETCQVRNEFCGLRKLLSKCHLVLLRRYPCGLMAQISHAPLS